MYRLFRLRGLSRGPDPAGAGRRAVASLQSASATRNEATAGFLRALHTAGRAGRDGLLAELDTYAGDEVARREARSPPPLATAPRPSA